MNKKETRLLVENWRDLISEMSRQAKIDHREKYNHPGLVKDALYAHWIFGSVSDEGIINFTNMLNKLENIEDKKHLFLYYHIIQFEKTIKKIKRGEELSCNLIDPNIYNPVYTNYSGDGIDPWGYFGLILKPKVVTMAYDGNKGIGIYDVGGGRLRKRTRPAEDFIFNDGHEESLRSSAQRIRDNFPLEDEDVYKKSFRDKPEEFKFFTYHHSEFVIVAEKVCGVVWLEGEYFHDYTVDKVFYNCKEELGLTKEELLEEKKSLEKDYLKKFCRAKGIRFYESGGLEIFNIPRLQSDL